MESLFQLDEALARQINEILTNEPVCEQCGGDADDCGCASMTEEKEEIDESSSFFVGRREFSDKEDADAYAKHIGGTVTPTSNPTHKGFDSSSPAHHPLHNVAVKHGYDYSGEGTTTRGGGSEVHRHEYKHPITNHKVTLGTHSKGGSDQHFWQHEGPGNSNPRHHGITSQTDYSKLKGSLNRHLTKTHESPEE